jgi:hypothetical protein
MPIRPSYRPLSLQQLNAGTWSRANPMFPGSFSRTRPHQPEKAVTLRMPRPRPPRTSTALAPKPMLLTATAPAEIAQSQRQCAANAAQAATAEANLATTGGANEGQAKSASFYTRAMRANQLYEGTGVKDSLPAARSP